MVCEEANWDRERFASFVLSFSEVSWAARSHPYRSLMRHLVGSCPVGCRCWHYSRGRHGLPVAGCLSTQDVHMHSALQGHQALVVVEVVAVSPFQPGQVVWVLVETGQPQLA